MKHVYTLHDPLLAGHLEQVLQQAGIHCMVKNKHLIGGVGDLPPIEAWPEIWVFRDIDESPAIEIIQAVVQYTANPKDAWTCTECGERIEAQFAECWNCARPPTNGFIA